MKGFILKFNQTEVTVPVDMDVISLIIGCRGGNKPHLRVLGIDNNFSKIWISENLKFGDTIDIKLSTIDKVSEPIKIESIGDGRLLEYKHLKKMLTEKGLI